MTVDDILDQLLEKAKEGKITRTELDAVAASLADPLTAGDPYTKLYIVAFDEAGRQRALVESFLDRPDDPMLSRLALQILCDFWGLTEDYLSRVKSFVTGVPWDEEEDVRQVAISIAGEYLNEKYDPELFEALLLIVDEPAEDELMREVAVAALARALGDSFQSLPDARIRTPINDEWSLDVINRAHERLLDPPWP